MSADAQKFYTILILSTLVTLAIRIIPFLLVKFMRFPDWLTTFLHYLPLTMMTALFVQNIFDKKTGHLLPLINFENLLAILPALVVGYLKNSLMAVVIVGIVCMAALRLLH